MTGPQTYSDFQALSKSEKITFVTIDSKDRLGASLRLVLFLTA